MNNSGISVQKIVSYYKIKPKDIWIILDEFNIPLGTVRIRKKGTSGGHNGLQSVINELGIGDFIRIKIGIAPLSGRPRKADLVPEIDRFVLSCFSKAEQKIINKAKIGISSIILQSIKKNNILAHTYKF